MLLTALLQRFIRVVATVVVDVALPALGNATAITALELSRAAGPVGAVGRVFVRLIAAVILAVALPRLGDAALVCTLPLVVFALVGSWKQDVQK